MKPRHHLFTWLLMLALALSVAEDGLAGKDDKKKKKKKKQSAESSETSQEESPSASPAPSAPKVVKDVDKRLLAYDTAGARSLLAGESVDSSPHLQLADGRILDQEGDYSKATARLAAAASALSDDPAPLLYLGEAHLRARNTRSANDAFAQAEQRAQALVNASPGDGNALYLLGVAQQGLSKYNEALNSLNQARAANPRDAMVVFQIGATQAFQRSWQAAIDTLTEAINMNPSIAYAYYYRGVAAGEMGRKDLLVNDLDRFLAMAPNAPEAEQARRLLGGL